MVELPRDTLQIRDRFYGAVCKLAGHALAHGSWERHSCESLPLDIGVPLNVVGAAGVVKRNMIRIVIAVEVGT